MESKEDTNNIEHGLVNWLEKRNTNKIAFVLTGRIKGRIEVNTVRYITSNQVCKISYPLIEHLSKSGYSIILLSNKEELPVEKISVNMNNLPVNLMPLVHSKIQIKRNTYKVLYDFSDDFEQKLKGLVDELNIFLGRHSSTAISSILFNCLADIAFSVPQKLIVSLRESA